MNNRTKLNQGFTKPIGIFGLMSLILLTLGLVLYPSFTAEHPSLSPKLTSKIGPENSTQQSHVKEIKPLQPSQDISHPLILELALRWTFDDIILEYQQTQIPLKPRLIQLAQNLALNSTDQAYLLALFWRYRDYQLALVEIKNLSPSIDEDMQVSQSYDFIEQTHDSQYRFFNDEEINAFFAQDNAYDRQAIARVAIRQDSSLTSEQKKRLLAHQISQLDESEQQALLPSLQAEKIVAVLNGSQTQPLEMTPEVSARVEKVKTTEMKWQARVKTYQDFQQTLEEDYVAVDVNAVEYEIKIEAYLKQHFTSQEIKRLQVFLKHPNLVDAS